MDFLLTDAIFAKAKIPKGNKSVHLWLGANIMVEYSFKEAKELLMKNLENAQSNLKVFVIEVIILC
jgi:Prefoldin subunit.